MARTMSEAYDRGGLFDGAFIPYSSFLRQPSLALPLWFSLSPLMRFRATLLARPGKSEPAGMLGRRWRGRREMKQTWKGGGGRGRDMLDILSASCLQV